MYAGAPLQVETGNSVSYRGALYIQFVNNGRGMLKVFISLQQRYDFGKEHLISEKE